MKFFLTALIVVLFNSGCTTKNAFTKLNLTHEQKRAVEHIQNGKIMNGTSVEAIYSVMYLNGADKNIQRTDNEFYIALYRKNDTLDLNITMNEQAALDIEKVASDNEYSDLLSTQYIWSRNYKVTFENNGTKNISLQIGTGPFLSAPLMFVKD